MFATFARRSLNSALQMQLSHKISRGSGATWTVRVYHKTELIVSAKIKLTFLKHLYFVIFIHTLGLCVSGVLATLVTVPKSRNVTKPVLDMASASGSSRPVPSLRPTIFKR